MEKFRKELSLIFNDDPKTITWHDFADKFIVLCLVLNAVGLFLSTFDDIQARYGTMLHLMDVATTAVFFVEVSLRIWVADLIDAKYKGGKGRLRYCLTPLGLIDIISTYPSVAGWFFQFSPTLLKSFRMLRLLRFFRMLKSFRMLSDAISNKSKELWLSFSVLVVITFMLSIALFYVEHAANPKGYANGLETVIWSFMQYVGDLDRAFAETPPATLIGQVISCIIGLLGIAVVAVPAGLVGAAFLDEMEKRQKVQEIAESRDKILNSFERRQCRETKFQTVPTFLSVYDLHVLVGLTQDEIIAGVRSANNLRLINLASTYPFSENPADRLAVEHFEVNTPYGCKIDRGSKITIVVTSSCVEPAMGNFGYYLAKIGGFNFVSRELGERSPYKSYYLIDEEGRDENLSLFMDDINSLANAEDHWVFYILAASCGQEQQLPTQIHFNYGGKKGDESYDDPALTLHDTTLFEDFYQDLSARLKTDFNLDTDKQRYYGTAGPRNIMRKLTHADRVNSVSIRLACSVGCWDLRRIAVAKSMADAMNRYLTNRVPETYNEDLYQKAIGFKERVK